MFLDRLIRTNPAFVSAALLLHQSGQTLANTYLLDLEMLRRNAQVITQAADAHNLRVYAMTKQFGRNPDASRALTQAGSISTVSVDLQCMEGLQRAGVPIGHVGHLVQLHRGSEDAVIAARPEVVTLFSVETARRLAAAAIRAQRTQDVLLRVTAPGDRFYFGHGGGFALDTIVQSAEAIAQLDGLRVAGVTTFPCLLADPQGKRVVPTPNFTTLRASAERLQAAGFAIWQVNAPGTTSAQTMEMLKQGGATHVEPGNAFHGTTPLHLFDPEAPEQPAMIYVSEVSHLDGNNAYIFGAGLYIDKVLGDYSLRALIGRDERIIERFVPVEMADPGAIHYYCIARLPAGHDVQVGDTAIFCFRPQAFVTRARTQAVDGVQSGRPIALGRYDDEARVVEGVS